MAAHESPQARMWRRIVWRKSRGFAANLAGGSASGGMSPSLSLIGVAVFATTGLDGYI